MPSWSSAVRGREMSNWSSAVRGREMPSWSSADQGRWLYFSRIAFLISSEGPQDILTKYSPDEAD